VVLSRLRVVTAGESHGPSLGVVVEGLPAGLFVDLDWINHQLRRRQQGYGRGGRMAIESDRVEVLSGVRHGLTLGSPVLMLVRNRDWENWRDTMSVEPVKRDSRERFTMPRPGHADLAGVIKYRHSDIRNVLERASARETAVRVAAGALCSLLLSELKVETRSHVVSIGSKGVKQSPSWDEIEKAKDSPVFCCDSRAEAEMMKEIDKAKAQGDTLGGVFEVRAKGVPVGLGSHVHWDRRLDTRIAAALMSIPAIKGVEIGPAFENAALPGSLVHDQLYPSTEGPVRNSNRAGGIEGGISNGEEIIVRCAMKPIPTLMRPLASVDLSTREAVSAAKERSDVCAVPAASVVGEAMLALVLADALLEKTGGDSMEELVPRVEEIRRASPSFS
jgi:chorismate synthase